MSRPSIDWAKVPLVVTDQATCPCGSTRTPHLIRSEANGDGTRTLRRICRDCCGAFKELIQYRLPNLGKPPPAGGRIEQ